MNEKHQEIIQQIIKMAKNQGLDQKELAAKAGITSPDLSRLKKSDNSRFSTMENLANAVGLKLALVADDALVEKIENGNLFQ